MVTIRSIAEAANVSRGTVDKVLNNRPGVSPRVREHVKKTAEEMGYKPNLAGKALAFQKNPVKIGVIITGEDDPFQQEVLEGVLSAYHELEDFGIALEYCITRNVDVNEQLDCIKKLHSKNISALVISPLDDDTIKDELNRISKDNVKVVTYNTDIADTDRMCFVGQNLKKSGRVAGDLVGKLLPDGGKVLVISGPEKIKALCERIEGFREVIGSEYPKIAIDAIIHNIDDDEHSYTCTVDILRKCKYLSAIYITARGIAGVCRAVRESDKKNIKIVCFDKIKETVDLINEKIIDFTITQEPFMQGYLPIKILFDYFFHNKMPADEHIYTKLEILTKQNIEA
jgi:LacI family transcriptional regulator